ncbi:hypothetical protein SCP_0209200 [Sparassis crispa]|uniref:RRN7-type domain-containing protein n=1 Tax=Sparassis crispa TaxID=139825 RepID=A0A401GC23_9APHY|nr:hypothetical protein SCP_0209200 [Sparassis crispa]GBE79719.1 hypothetical protein SCP_0209200 [Sparassis crispa]
MAPRRRCPVCGSRQWHKEPSSGLITCNEGHVLQSYRNETREVTELGPHTLRKRTLKSNRKRKEKQSNADPKLYHGERARYHYFQCLQLILRMQVAALTRLWELPPEFEMVCRDIWTLHLELLPQPPPAEPLEAMHGEGDKKQTEQSSQVQVDTQPADISDGEEPEEEAKDSSDESSSSESDEDEDDAELAALMRENSSSSSSSDEDIEKQPKKNVSKKGVQGIRSSRRYDSPASNISVLVLACWTLRLPVIYMDFVRLIEAYELPYLDPVRLLPTSLAQHLTKHTAHALSPHHSPKPVYLHIQTSRLARLMYSTYEISTPEMNAPPILWRAVRGLRGTPTLYMLAKTLARVLSIPLTLHRSLASGFKRTEQGEHGWHRYDNAVPEVSLAATVIIVMKMVYGLDGEVRHPQEKDDPARTLPLLSDLLACIKDLDERSKMDEDAIFSAKSPMSVVDLSEPMLDKYLDFCERALLVREDKRTERHVMADFFPLHPAPAPPASKAGSESEPLRRLTAPEISLDAESQLLLSPAESYSIYNTQDILGTLPEQLELVIKRASSWAGLDEEYLCGVVERFERRLVRWWDGVKKKEREETSLSEVQ